MDLTNWLTHHNMEINEFAKIIGVTRQVIWKIKKGKTVDSDTAKKVYFVTGGQVKPVTQRRGRPRKKI